MHNPIDNRIVHPLRELAADPQALADRLASLPHIPGVQTAGVLDGAIRTGVAGLTDLESEQPVLPRTRFRPGSITKLLTAGLVVHCADKGELSLEDPVSRYLPGPWPDDLRLRHLIGHTSGLDAGDLFLDTGDSDDRLARYADHLTTVGSLFPPGTAFSYCNGGFVLAGRILELVLGQPFEHALRTRVLDPAGMANTSFLRDSEAAQDPDAARGHDVRDSRALPLPLPVGDPMCTPSLAPAGSTLVTTAADLARFTRAHLDEPGTEIMRALQVPAPGGVPTMRGPGLGWMLWSNARYSSVRIGGAYPGQSGIITADPENGAAIVVLTNSRQGIDAATSLLDPPTPSHHHAHESAASNLDGYTGRYASHVTPLDVQRVGDGLLVRAAGLPDLTLAPQDRLTFTSPAGPVAFFDFDDDGRPGYLRWRMRVWRRIP
ncbi:beta-lactamase family protein [Streptomyces sp. A7024]|uniref:Beta-lactamase family protein n=1 Tax=Streptomyces coryli TaxID=1128680 RepID=A0A6G4TRW8_9ACTN|nr:serine hydrolase domain-containing protein [Streptomyces coryli]NGN62735.1 beta-lactamase family protein [Streptomyces coryli]